MTVNGVGERKQDDFRDSSPINFNLTFVLYRYGETLCIHTFTFMSYIISDTIRTVYTAPQTNRCLFVKFNHPFPLYRSLTMQFGRNRFIRARKLNEKPPITMGRTYISYTMSVFNKRKKNHPHVCAYSYSVRTVCTLKAKKNKKIN